MGPVTIRVEEDVLRAIGLTLAEALQRLGAPGASPEGVLASGGWELAAFRVRLHSRIDGLELDADEAQEVVQEARMAFRRHALVCAELARGATGIAAREGSATRAPCPSR